MWKRTSLKKYYEMLGMLPPRHIDSHGFLVGEAADHDFCQIDGVVMPRYQAYAHKRKRYYVSIRPLTLAEYRKWAPRLIAGKRVK
jgi:hypothetical protein